MNVYKDFVVLHNMTLDPRDVKLFVDWLLASDKDSTAYKIGEAMQEAIDNYCDNLNFERGLPHNKCFVYTLQGGRNK